MRRQLPASSACSLLVGLLAWPAVAALESGVYQAPPGASVDERGDRVPGGSRVVPLSATLTFDLRAAPPSLIAVLPNAVVEGGAPFALTVRSSSGGQLPDGTYLFTGDYLRDIDPTGTQYAFDWRFLASTNGQVVWTGGAYWAGGHLWQVTFSNITLMPRAWLQILRQGSASARITWATNFADHVLEYATAPSVTGWTALTNAVTVAGDHLSVTVEMDGIGRFYRLRKP